MITHILAIDPGSSGGIVELYASGVAVAHPMPDDGDLRDLIECFAASCKMEGVRAVCYMEIVGGMIKVGGKNVGMGPAMFKFGSGFGYARGLVDAARIERRMILPKQWQAGIPGLVGDKADRKRALKEHAARLFPQLKVTLMTADALCIADYARRQIAAIDRAA